MENFEPKEYRDSLAKKISESPKEYRTEILENAKKTNDYWQSRSEKTANIQEEETTDGGLSVLIKKKTLYHGSNIKGISNFKPSEAITIGAGVYLTSEAKNAVNYARVRSYNNQEDQTIYEVFVENLKLIDLRNPDNISKIIPGFVEMLRKEKMRSDLSWIKAGQIDKTLENIERASQTGGNLKNVAEMVGEHLSKYLSSLGYDGLIAIEGGEGSEGFTHDSYVIFDPEKVRINQESYVA